jgi:hypothetical protein
MITTSAKLSALRNLEINKYRNKNEQNKTSNRKLNQTMTFQNKAVDLLLIGFALPPTNGYNLRRAKQQQQQQQQQQTCVPANDVESTLAQSSTNSLFVMLEVNDPEVNLDEDVITQQFTGTYNSMVECTQNGARRAINQSILMASALEQEDNGARTDNNGSTTSMLLEIDMSCNSCGNNYWQIFNALMLSWRMATSTTRTLITQILIVVHAMDLR